MDHHHHHIPDGGHDMATHDMSGHHMGSAGTTEANIHSGHDMSGHDMSGHSMGGHSMMDMNMWFQFTTNSTVLFEQWHFTTVGGLIGSMIGIFIMAALYEGLKYYREFLFWKTYNALQYKAVSLPDKATIPDEPQVVHVVGEVIHKQPPAILSKIHFYQTFLHMIQMILSYFLMLIFMTYNVWLCIAVVLGAGVGYFLFGWKKGLIVDVTEHCH